MILTEFIDVSVQKRNLAKIRSILGDSVSVNTIARVYREDFYTLNNRSIVLLSCDKCGTFHKRWLTDLVEKHPNKDMQICNGCISINAVEKMRITVRAQEYRKTRSNTTKQFYTTTRGANAKIIASEKFKQWTITPEGKAHIEKSKLRLPRMYGENHPNFNPNKTEYNKYKYLVYKETKKFDLSILPNYDKPRKLCGVDGGYQLDHILSIKYGFDNNIDPAIIGNIKNLQFIPWEENRKKWHQTNRG